MLYIYIIMSIITNNIINNTNNNISFYFLLLLFSFLGADNWQNQLCKLRQSQIPNFFNLQKYIPNINIPIIQILQFTK